MFPLPYELQQPREGAFLIHHLVSTLILSPVEEEEGCDEVERGEGIFLGPFFSTSLQCKCSRWG